MSKCTMRLVRNWTLLIVGFGYAAIGVFWLLAGRLPAVDQLRYSISSTREMPLTISRLADPLLILLPVGLLVLALAKYDRLPGGDSKTAKGQSIWGVIFGILGIITIGIWGAFGAFYGALVAVILIYIGFSCYDAEDDIPSYIIQPIAGLVIWAGSTVIFGVAPGLLYATIALLTATTLHYGLIGIYMLMEAFISGPFKRWFLQCDTDKDKRRQPA